MSVLSVWYCTGWILFSSFFNRIYARSFAHNFISGASVPPWLDCSSSTRPSLDPCMREEADWPIGLASRPCPGDNWPRLFCFARPPAQLMSAQLVSSVIAASNCHS